MLDTNVFQFFSAPSVYYIPIRFVNTLKSKVSIRTSLPVPYEAISLGPNQVLEHTMRSTTSSAVTIYAEERVSGKRILVGGKLVLNIMPQIKLGQIYQVEITRGKSW